MLKINENGSKELTIGLMNNEQIAEWFGIKLQTFRNTRKKRLEELKNFCLYETIIGGIDIKEIYFPVYEKKATKNYGIIRDAFDKEWSKTGLDSGSNVALKIYNKHKNELTIAERTTYDYTLKARNELYGKPWVGIGKNGKCIYLWCKKEMLEDGTCLLTQFTEEEEKIKKDLMKQYFSTDIDKEVMIAEMVKSGELTKAEGYNALMEIKNINDRSFLSFLRDLESHIGSSVIRGTLIQKINKEEFVNFGDNINQTFKLN